MSIVLNCTRIVLYFPKIVLYFTKIVLYFTYIFVFSRKTKYLPNDCFKLLKNCFKLLKGCFKLLKDCFLLHQDCFILLKDCFLLTHFYTRDCFILHFEIVLYYTPESKKRGGAPFNCAPHVFWSLRTPARTPGRTSGVLIMRNFLKRADRVTHRKLPSGPVPEQGRHRYCCNLGLEPENSGNCNRSCAEVAQNRVQVSDVRMEATLIF